MKLARALAAVILVLAVALSGCRVGPNYRTPALPKGAEVPWRSFDPALETPASPADAWWQLYDDSRLSGLVQEALGANRDLAAADANFAAARAIVAAAKSGRYPSTRIEAGGIYGRDATTDEILELGGHRPESIWLIEDLFEVGYEVDLFGRVRRSVEAADANAESVAAARDAVSVVTAAETARTYAELCALGEQLAVARHSLDVVSHEADITVHRQEAGASSEYDVARAQALAYQVRSTIAPLEGRRRAVLFELTAILGRTPANAPNDLEACVVPPHLSALIPIGDGAQLLKRRPDVRQAERRLAAATAQIGVATADLYPTIHLSGLVGGVGSQLSDLTANRGLTWGIGPSVTWVFPNQTGPRARVRQTRANEAAALAGFDSVVLKALKETEQALALYGAALENRRSLGDSQDKVHAAFHMASEQFLAGSLSNLDLLTTEQSLVAIDASVAVSDAALVQNQIAVFKALGGGWEPATKAPPVATNPRSP